MLPFNGLRLYVVRFFLLLFALFMGQFALGEVQVALNAEATEATVAWDARTSNPQATRANIRLELEQGGPDIWDKSVLLFSGISGREIIPLQVSATYSSWDAHEYDTYYFDLNFCYQVGFTETCENKKISLNTFYPGASIPPDLGASPVENDNSVANELPTIKNIIYIHTDHLGSPVAETAH